MMQKNQPKTLKNRLVQRILKTKKIDFSRQAKIGKIEQLKSTPNKPPYNIDKEGKKITNERFLGTRNNEKFVFARVKSES